MLFHDVKYINVINNYTNLTEAYLRKSFEVIRGLVKQCIQAIQSADWRLAMVLKGNSESRDFFW